MKRQYGELLFILAVGALQPAFELCTGPKIAAYYNGIAVLIVSTYVAYRLSLSGKTLLHQWGLRTDNFWQCLPPYLSFAAIAGLLLVAYGATMGNELPKEFWYVLALYPIWGLAQQFVLQNFVANNLEQAIPSLPLRALATATIFACAHIPSVELVVLTFAAGFCFTFLFHTYRNLFALGIAHGILGALTFHLVLGQNQWEILLKYFS